jgi:hypothetical protein
MTEEMLAGVVDLCHEAAPKAAEWAAASSLWLTTKEGRRPRVGRVLTKNMVKCLTDDTDPMLSAWVIKMHEWAANPDAE